MGPDHGSGMYPYAYYRQTTVPDLGAMAQRAGAKYLMLTHLIPPIGAAQQYPFKVPGNPLTEADYRKAAQDGGCSPDKSLWELTSPAFACRRSEQRCLWGDTF